MKPAAAPFPLSRRRALVALAGAGLALAAPRRGRAAPAKPRLRLAFIGVGGRGRGNVLNLADHDFVAFADVDDARAAEIYAQFPAVPRYRDYRQLLDRHAGGLDGVVVSTPDHLHHSMGRDVIAAGKHLYLEKPLAPTLWECRELGRLAAASTVRTQLGVQGHGFEALRVLREWLDAGAAGRVERVVLWSDRMKPKEFVQAAAPAAPEPVPTSLDWNLWLGPRRARPYSPLYAPSRWRNWWDFGAGALTDIGVHMFDALQFALDLGYPEQVTAETSDRSPFTAPAWSRVAWRFGATARHLPLTVEWIGGWRDGALVKPGAVPHLPADLIARTDNAIAIVGSEATLFIPDLRASVRPRIYPPGRERDFLAAPPPRRLPRPVGGHHQDWIDAIVQDRPAGAPFSYGAPLTEKVLLGTLAQRTGQAIAAQPGQTKFPGNPAADALVRPPG